MTDAEAPVEIPADNVVDLHSNVAKDLLEKVQALYALSKTSHILQNGSYRLSLVDEVHQAINFIGVMHKGLLDEALAHPDCDKVAKLVEVKKLRDAEGKSDASTEKGPKPVA